ncbi:MAG TPA: GatB/YqeY domain-containing protein [Pseudomonadales bacterium]|nr:GatB/YqeY domain-containing protein [Pseudomonadales bacterium]
MSDLRGRIAEATKDAMKSREKSRVAVLRLIGSEIKRIEVDERRELPDADVLAVLNRMLKQRNDSESQFRAAGRTDLADQEAFEIGLIREFMPEALGESQIDAAIRDAIAASGATSMRDMGKVMSALRDALQGRADMAVVSTRVKALLGAAQ